MKFLFHYFLKSSLWNFIILADIVSSGKTYDLHVLVPPAGEGVFKLYDVSISAMLLSADATQTDFNREDANVCETAHAIHSSVIKTPRFPQYSKFVQLLADRGTCRLKLSEKQKGVCKRTEGFQRCCDQQYEKDLLHFFKARECLISLVFRSSVLEGLIAHNVGAYPKAIERLINAKKDVASKDARDDYSSSITLMNEIVASVHPLRHAAKSKKFEDTFENIRFFIADMLCGACNPSYVSSLKSGETMIMKINAEVFQKLRWNAQYQLKEYLNAIGTIFRLVDAKNGWIDRILTLRIRHFLGILQHLVEDLKLIGENNVDALIHEMKVLSSSYQYFSDHPVTTGFSLLQIDNAPQQLKPDTDSNQAKSDSSYSPPQMVLLNPIESPLEQKLQDKLPFSLEPPEITQPALTNTSKSPTASLPALTKLGSQQKLVSISPALEIHSIPPKRQQKQQEVTTQQLDTDPMVQPVSGVTLPSTTLSTNETSVATETSTLTTANSDGIIPIPLEEETVAEENHVKDSSKLRERVRKRFLQCAHDLRLHVTNKDGSFTGEVSEEGFKKKFESSLSELSLHDFLVNFGLGPQLCIYDLLVNLLAMLPDPRVDASFESLARAENGTLITSRKKTMGGNAMHALAHGILATLEREMSRAALGKLTKDDTLFINEQGDLVRNRTLTEEREKEETAQLQLQKEAVEEFKRQKRQVNEGPELPNSSSMLQISSTIKDTIREFLDDSESYYKSYGLHLPRHSGSSLIPYTETTEDHQDLRLQQPHLLMSSSDILKGLIAFVENSQPEGSLDFKSVTVVFSSDAPDPRGASEHQILSQDLEPAKGCSQSICALGFIFYLFCFVLFIPY